MNYRCFNSTLVQLKGIFFTAHLAFIQSFNSTLVQLKVPLPTYHS